MTLRELVKEYREAHELSQRQFAVACGLSNGYISMLERNSNPKTGLPVTPSIPALKKIASGMGMSLNDLFLAVDDMPVDILDARESESTPTSGAEGGCEREAMRYFEALSPERRAEALSYLRYLAEREDK